MLAMLVPLGVIVAMCAGWHPFGSVDLAKATLLLAVTVPRFIDGLVTPLLYRVAGDPFPESERQAGTQWAGVVAIVVATIGTWLATLLVFTGVIS